MKPPLQIIGPMLEELRQAAESLALPLDGDTALVVALDGRPIVDVVARLNHAMTRTAAGHHCTAASRVEVHQLARELGLSREVDRLLRESPTNARASWCLLLGPDQLAAMVAVSWGQLRTLGSA